MYQLGQFGSAYVPVGDQCLINTLNTVIGSERHVYAKITQINTMYQLGQFGSGCVPVGDQCILTLLSL